MKTLMMAMFLMLPMTAMGREPVHALLPHEFKVRTVDVGHTRNTNEECLRVYVDVNPPIRPTEEVHIEYANPVGLFRSGGAYGMTDGKYIDNVYFTISGHNNDLNTDDFLPYAYGDYVHYYFYLRDGTLDKSRLKYNNGSWLYVIALRAGEINGLELIFSPEDKTKKLADFVEDVKRLKFKITYQTELGDGIWMGN